jgi:cytochrome c biogenesis protein CcmG/thiol:disulfide interchange protein DsbE
MRTFQILTALIVLLNSAIPVNGAELAPDWSLESADGEVIRLSEEVSNQTTVLLFWATWCPYCKALMPHLQSIRLEYGDDVRILAINFREKGDPVGFIREAGYDFTILPDGDDVATAYEVWGTPGLIVVDAEQRIRFDLRALPRIQPPAEIESASRSAQAAYLAPYWAAELRKAIDDIVATTMGKSQPASSNATTAITGEFD